ncbi:MAG TPA: LacI family DNA-binding transcriptional regulator [Phycisphaerae bacterium]|nr:LacI family DNA-binding transcriptional regulator [Phycisphaerae bacterium]HPS52340.1 LacI family DNA-binding transcriptional regulator [Phycisphaerae bacterium]
MDINRKKLEEFLRANRPAMLRDIAEIAGCSLAAVSTTLNNSSSTTGVSAAKRQLILKAAELVSYRPNFAAKSLVSRQSKTIGVCLRRTARYANLGPFYEAPMLQGIEQAARRSDYDILLVDNRDCVKKFAENRMDALILLPGLYARKELNDIIAASPNIIAIDYAPNDRIDAVIFDNFAAVRLAVEHLAGLGHRRIGFIGNLHENPMADVTTRCDAFLEIAQKMSLPTDGMVFNLSLWRKSIHTNQDYCSIEGMTAAKYFMSRPSDVRPTAVICYNDVVASGAINAFTQAGLNLPGDMSIVGIDNSQICSFLKPALTSIRHPLEEMGELAVQRLIEKLAPTNMEYSKSLTVLQPELVVRNSTAGPK